VKSIGFRASLFPGTGFPVNPELSRQYRRFPNVKNAMTDLLTNGPCAIQTHIRLKASLLRQLVRAVETRNGGGKCLASLFHGK
jgi:hypothetical protein